MWEKTTHLAGMLTPYNVKMWVTQMGIWVDVGAYHGKCLRREEDLH